MRDEEDRLSPRGELLDRVEAAAREGLVAHREDLVDDEDLGVDVDRDREAEPHVHPRRVGLDRLVDELREPGELDDRRELPLDLAARQAEHDAVDDDVLAARDLRVEAGSELDEGRDLPVDAERPRRSA